MSLGLTWWQSSTGTLGKIILVIPTLPQVVSLAAFILPWADWQTFVFFALLSASALLPPAPSRWDWSCLSCFSTGYVFYLPFDSTKHSVNCSEYSKCKILINWLQYYLVTGDLYSMRCGHRKCVLADNIMTALEIYRATWTWDSLRVLLLVSWMLGLLA